MNMKRIWTMAVGSVVGVFLFVACGASATSTVIPTPTPAPTPAPAPSATTAPGSEPAGVATPRAVPSSDGASGAAPTQDAAAQSGSTAGYAWEVSTVDEDAAKPSLAVSADGVPHIAYLLEDMPGFVKHAVLNGDGWDISTVATGYFYGPLDVQVDQEGVPHITWHDHDNENEAYAVLTDGEWAVQDVDHPGHDGWDNNLAIDSKNLPHTISIDPSQFGSTSGVEYATFDGQSWSVEEVGSGPTPYEFGTGIALDSQDRPHVVWFDADDENLKYAVKEGGSWSISTVDSEGDVGRYPSLVLDGLGNPVISYFESTDDNAGYIKLARWDGSQWVLQRVDKLENVAMGFLGARKTNSLVLDGDDNPIVAYSDEKVVKVARWDEAGWHRETVLNAGDSPFGQQVSLAMDNDGVLHLTFAEVTTSGRPGVKGVVKYAKGAPQAVLAAEPPPTIVPTPTAEPISPPDGRPSRAPGVEPDPDFQVKLNSSRLSTRVWKTDFSRHTVEFDEIFSGGPGRDGIPPIDDPKFTTPELANEWLGDLEPVIAFEHNGDARAYPLQILMWHEVANDVVGGKPVLVTFCPLCNSAIVSWSDFRAAHPDGKVLSRETGFSRNYGSNPYVGYDRVDNPPFLFRGDLDGRLLPKERVAAVTVGDADVAFPFSVLDTERVVNYNVSGLDLAVFFKPGTRSALGGALIGSAEEIGATGVFEANLDGRNLTFRADGDAYLDNETGSTWTILGVATDGPLAGKQLTPIVHANHFWFAWGAFKPDTVIYQGAG